MSDVTEACRAFAANLTAQGYSDCPVGDVDDDALERAMRAALATLPKQTDAVEAERWRDIASAPQDEPILAAVEVVNNKTNQHWWERHVIVIDSDTGNVTHDTDAGWSAGDYTHWMPLPEPPAAIRGAK